MPREGLDDWFAEADGMLAGWQGSPDAMSVRAEPDDADPELPLLGDNGADQTWPLRRRLSSRAPKSGLVATLRRHARRLRPWRPT